MSRFAVLALCVQACLIQAALSCNCNYNCGSQISYGLPGLCNQQVSCQLPVIEQVSYQVPAIEQVSYQLPAIEQVSYSSRPIELQSYGCVEPIYQSLPSVGCGVAYNAPAVSVSAPAVSVSAPVVSNVNVGSYGASLPASSGIFEYGGRGEGVVYVDGDIDASGYTSVVGSVPVQGVSEFYGLVSASGSVSITGQCGCGCIEY